MSKREPFTPSIRFGRRSGRGSGRRFDPSNYDTTPDHPSMVSSDPYDPNRSTLSPEDQSVADAVMVKSIFEEYYARGINVLRPEILLAAEFLPLRKLQNTNPQMALMLGLNRNANINQVYRLLELHQSVQKSINISSLNFIDETSDFNVVEVYEEAKSNYAKKIIRGTLEETVEAYIRHLSSNLLETPGSKIGVVRVTPTVPNSSQNGPGKTQGGTPSRSRSLSNLTLQTKHVRNVKDLLEKGKSNTGKDTGGHATKYVSFRSMLLSGSNIQKKAIRRILEIIIIEKLTYSLFKYFSRFVNLKENVIPREFDIKKLSQDDMSARASDNEALTNKLISYLKKPFPELPSINEASTIPIAVNVFTGEPIEPHDYGSYANVTSEKIANYVLKASDLNSEMGNYDVIYNIIAGMLSDYRFTAPGIRRDDQINQKAGSTLNVNYYSPTVIEKYRDRVTQWIKNTSLSSFIYGNVKLTNYSNTARKDKNEKLNTTYHTSKTVYEKTSQKGRSHHFTDDVIPETLLGSSELQTDTIVKVFRRGDGNKLYGFYEQTQLELTGDIQQFDSFEMNAELLCATIFDITTANNISKYSNSAFGESLSSNNRTLGFIIDELELLVLGDRNDPYGLVMSPSEAIVGKRIGEMIRLDPDDEEKIEHNLGKFGDSLLKLYKVADESVKCLPGSHSDFRMKGVLPGTQSIPLEAFTDGEVLSLTRYASKLEYLTSRLSMDMSNIFGIFSSKNAQLFPPAAGNAGSPAYVLNQMLNSFGNLLRGRSSIDDGYNGIPNTLKMLEDLKSDEVELDDQAVESGHVSTSMATADHVNDLINLSSKQLLTVMIMMAAAEDPKIMASTFLSFFLSNCPYFEGDIDADDNGKWFSTMARDARNRSLKLIFSKFGKTLQYYPFAGGKESPDVDDYEKFAQAVSSYTDGSGDERTTYYKFDGQYSDFFYQVSDRGSEVAGADKGTFISDDHFAGGLAAKLGYDFNFEESFLAAITGQQPAGNSSKSYKNNKDDIFEDFADCLSFNGGLQIQAAINLPDLALFAAQPENFEKLKRDISDLLASTRYITSGTMVGSDREAGTSSVGWTFCNDEAEKIGTIDSLLTTSCVHRSFAAYSMFCKILSEALTIEVHFLNNEKGKNPRMKLKYNKVQFKALADALSKPGNQGTGFPEGLAGRQLYLTERARIDAIVNKVKAPLVHRRQASHVGFAALTAHINNLNNLKEKIKKTAHNSNINKTLELAIKHYGISAEGSSENQGSSLFENSALRMSFLNYISSRSMSSMYKNYIDLIADSKSNRMFSTTKEVTDRQLYQMKLAFSGPEFGMTEEEKLGKKTILNIGVPPMVVEQLGLEGTSHNTSYFNSPYICIHIFKKDALGGNITYYPKPFIFNSQVIASENFDLYGLQPPSHEEKGTTIRNFEGLLRNFGMYMYRWPTEIKNYVKEYKSLLIDENDLAYMDASSDGSRDIALKEMKTNHMFDYYLKMYMRLTLGLDLSEYVFPLNADRKLSGQVDDRVKELFDLYSDQLFLKYPSINVDVILAREFIRLQQNIRSSKFFSFDEKVANIFNPKCFERIYSVFVNESDFVVYPYPEHFAVGSSDLSPTLVSEQPFIKKIPDLYDPCPYFNLDSKRQILGINSESKTSIASGILNQTELANMGSVPSTSHLPLNSLTGKTKQFYKHMKEVESDSAADVYEFFSVVTVIRRSE